MEPWLLCMYALSAVRFALWRWFVSADPAPSQIDRWERLAVIMGATSGVLWGIGGIVLHAPGHLPCQLIVLITIAGIGSCSAYMSAPLPYAVLAFVYPSLALSASPFFLEGDAVHLSLGIAALALMPLQRQLTLRVCNSLVESMNVRLRNTELVQRLREQKDAAEHANIAKSRFLAMASHDLRQPLHALGLFVQALQESPLAAAERQIVGHVRRTVEAMEELFDSLLDISRLDAGIVRPRPTTFGLGPMFDRLRSEFGPIARQKGLSLRVMKTSAYVRTDSSLFERIIRNLLCNALQYTDRGGVVLGYRREGEHLRVEVCDTGRGIPPDKHREIFREFLQLEAAGCERRTGLGLGLAIVERLARLLDHKLHVSSIPGKGSAFAITVPRGSEQDLAQSRRADLVTVLDLTGVLILVIDADPTVCQAMEALLGKWNCAVVTALSGPQMKDKVAGLRRAPDLIISDYGSGSAEQTLAGVDLLRTEFNADIPALLLTGDTDNDWSCDDPTLGLPILHKPVNPARLRTLITNMLRLDEAAKEQARCAG
jgi:signal transduction histidine kinase